MSGSTTYHGVLLVFLILAVIALGLLAAYAVPALRQSRHIGRLQAKQGEDFFAAYNACRDAVDAVITELESSPASYETFPVSIREQLDAAHQKAAAAEGKKGIR